MAVSTKIKNKLEKANFFKILFLLATISIKKILKIVFHVGCMENGIPKFICSESAPKIFFNYILYTINFIII